MTVLSPLWLFFMQGDRAKQRGLDLGQARNWVVLPFKPTRNIADVMGLLLYGEICATFGVLDQNGVCLV
jgi:hypothetical protein